MSKIDPRLQFLQQEEQASLRELEHHGNFSLEVEGTPSPLVGVLVHFTDSLAPLQTAGFQPRTIAGDVATGTIELSRLNALSELANVVRIEGSRPMTTELDVSIPNVRANLVHTGTNANKGSGALIGIIDSGIDYQHRSFRNADGTSRIQFIWDQRLTPTGTESNPADYAYGVQYTKANIDTALASTNPQNQVRHVDSDSGHGHGTHVAGIAGGNGKPAGNGQPEGTFVGVAPEAEFIIVRNIPDSAALGDSAATLDAVKYIFDRAAQLDKPVAINLSQGDNLGPHDGTSLLERGIDNLLGTPGRAMIKSAGNAANDKIHAGGRVASGGSETVNFLVPAGDTSPDTLDIWYSGRDRFDFTITTPGGSTSSPVSPGNTTTLDLSNGNRAFVRSVIQNPENQDNRIYITLSRGTAAAIQQGNWSFTLQGTTVVDGRFDAWIERGRVIPEFTGTHQDQSRTISVPGTSREVIAVASYVTKGGSGVGGISVFSSRGPSRDGRIKPEIAAPGQVITAARASGISHGTDQYHGISGTSMAAPHVAGTAALLLAARPQLTNQQILAGLKETARSDSSTGTVPNNTWGSGKLDVKAAADHSFPATVVSNWARIHPLIDEWPGGADPPTFVITANENGTAVVELAWDPQALLAPSFDYPEPLRYFNTQENFNKTTTADDGSSVTINIPAQVIQLTGNRAEWTIPQDLWNGYVQESLKQLRTPPTTTFTRNIYYRVRFQPTGASTAISWPSDDRISTLGASAPRLAILPISGSPMTQVLPDDDAIQQMGGLGSFWPNYWGGWLRWMWEHLPETDLSRQALVRIFAHPVYQNQIGDAAARGKFLRLWIHTLPQTRAKLPDLLSRQVHKTGGGTEPAVIQRDLKNSGTLVDNLLGLLHIVPHSDLAISATYQLVDDVITEILDPNGQSNQGAAGMCSPTSTQTMVLELKPAEYARLQIGLLSSSGSAELANSDIITIPPGIFQVARYAGSQTNPFFIRTNAELAFQAAVLKYAQGSRFPSYDPTAAPNAPNGINTVFQATISAGLSLNEIERSLEGILNTPFTAPSWPTSDTQFQAVRDNFLQAMSTLPHPFQLVMYWNAPRGTPNQGAHAVVAMRHEGGRVFFKNPQYSGSNPPSVATPGSSRDNPPRRYDDPTNTLESIGDADLLSWIISYFVPDNPL